MDKNVSRVFEVYQNLFFLQQSDKSLTDYYTLFKGFMDELDQYHPLTTDIEVLKQQWEKFYVSKFLSSLQSNFQSVRSQILATDGSIPFLSSVYARLLRVTFDSLSIMEPINKDNSAFVTSPAPRGAFQGRGGAPPYHRARGDRKSTRLNSSH